MSARESAVRVCLVFPELLGTYGDSGNATVLAQRLRWRGLPAEVVPVAAGTPVPAGCDIYVLGGGEDAPQTLATKGLAEQGLARAVDAGAVVLAVCAGLQLIGTTFTAADGTVVDGVGLLDCATRPRGSRMIGELVVEPTGLDAADGTPMPPLTGFENHGGITTLGAGARPLGAVVSGHGNGADNTEGAVAGKVVGTYLHGPALARNPALADRLLSWVVGPSALGPIDDAIVDQLRSERLADAAGGAADGWRATLKALLRRG